MSDTFITAVQERSTLWDKRNRNYHNRLLSNCQWEEVAAIIGTTSDVAKKKWKNLRDTFAKELKRNSKPSSAADDHDRAEYKGTWPYFESMTFLKVVLKRRKTDENTQHSAENNAQDSLESPCGTSKDDFDANFTQNSPEGAAVINDKVVRLQSPEVERLESVIPLRSKATETGQKEHIYSLSTNPIRVTKSKRKHEGRMEIQREKIKVTHQGQSDDNDDDLLWFKSILPYMKQLPPLNKLHFRTRMQEMLLTELSKCNTSHITQTYSQYSCSSLDIGSFQLQDRFYGVHKLIKRRW